MGTFHVCILVVCILTFVRGYRPMAQVLAEEGDLLAYFPFDKDFEEVSNKVKVTSENFPKLLRSAGFTGGSAQFNGLNSFLKVNLDIRREKFMNFTFGCWARAYEVGNHIRWLISNDGLSLDRSLGIDSRSGRWGWSVLSGQKTEGGLSVKTNAWQFVAVTFDGKEGRIFVDDRYSTFHVFPSHGKDFFEIGRAPCCGQHWFGEIDNVFVYGNALSVGQVEELRRRFIEERLLLELRARGLLAYFPFEKTFGGSPNLVDLQQKVKVSIPQGSIFQSVPGFKGNALRLNGSQYVQVEMDISGSAHKDLTIGCFVRSNTFSMANHRTIVSNGQDRELGTSNSGYSVYDGRAQFGGLEVHTGEWQFVAASYSNVDRLVTLVVDDVTKNGVYHMSYPKKATFDIGRSTRVSNTPQFWNGDIDNLFILEKSVNGDTLHAIKVAFQEAKRQTEGH